MGKRGRKSQSDLLRAKNKKLIQKSRLRLRKRIENYLTKSPINDSETSMAVSKPHRYSTRSRTSIRGRTSSKVSRAVGSSKSKDEDDSEPELLETNNGNKVPNTRNATRGSREPIEKSTPKRIGGPPKIQTKVHNTKTKSKHRSSEEIKRPKIGLSDSFLKSNNNGHDVQDRKCIIKNLRVNLRTVSQLTPNQRSIETTTQSRKVPDESAVITENISVEHPERRLAVQNDANTVQEMELSSTVKITSISDAKRRSPVSLVMENVVPDTNETPTIISDSNAQCNGSIDAKKCDQKLPNNLISKTSPASNQPMEIQPLPHVPIEIDKQFIDNIRLIKEQTKKHVEAAVKRNNICGFPRALAQKKGRINNETIAFEPTAIRHPEIESASNPSSGSKNEINKLGANVSNGFASNDSPLSIADEKKFIATTKSKSPSLSEIGKLYNKCHARQECDTLVMDLQPKVVLWNIAVGNVLSPEQKQEICRMSSKTFTTGNSAKTKNVGPATTNEPPRRTQSEPMNSDNASNGTKRRRPQSLQSKDHETCNLKKLQVAPKRTKKSKYPSELRSKEIPERTTSNHACEDIKVSTHGDESDATFSRDENLIDSHLELRNDIIDRANSLEAGPVVISSGSILNDYADKRPQLRPSELFAVTSESTFDKKSVPSNSQRDEFMFAPDANIVFNEYGTYPEILSTEAISKSVDDGACKDVSISECDLDWYPIQEAAVAEPIASENQQDNTPVERSEETCELPVLLVPEMSNEQWDLVLSSDALDFSSMLDSDNNYCYSEQPVVTVDERNESKSSHTEKLLPKIIEDQIFPRNTVHLMSTKLDSTPRKTVSDAKKKSSRTRKSRAGKNKPITHRSKSSFHGTQIPTKSCKTEHNEVPVADNNVTMSDIENMWKICPEIETFLQKNTPNNRNDTSDVHGGVTMRINDNDEPIDVQTRRNGENTNVELFHCNGNNSISELSMNDVDVRNINNNIIATRSDKIDDGTEETKKIPAPILDLTIENLSKFNEISNSDFNAATWYSYFSSNVNEQREESAETMLDGVKSDPKNENSLLSHICKDTNTCNNNNEQQSSITVQRKRRWISNKTETDFQMVTTKAMKLDRRQWSVSKDENPLQSQSSNRCIIFNKPDYSTSRLRSDENSNFTAPKTANTVTNGTGIKEFDARYANSQNSASTLLRIDAKSDTVSQNLVNPARKIDDNRSESKIVDTGTHDINGNLTSKNSSQTSSSSSSSSSSTTSSSSSSSSSPSTSSNGSSLKIGADHVAESAEKAETAVPLSVEDSRNNNVNDDEIDLAAVIETDQKSNDNVAVCEHDATGSSNEDCISLYAESLFSKQSHESVDSHCIDLAKRIDESYDSTPADFDNYMQKNIEECDRAYNEANRTLDISRLPDKSIEPVDQRHGLECCDSRLMGDIPFSTVRSHVNEAPTDPVDSTISTCYIPDQTDTGSLFFRMHHIFRGHCYSVLRRGSCSRHHNCRYAHQPLAHLNHLAGEHPDFVMEVMISAIQQKFSYFIHMSYSKVIMKMNAANVIELFHKLYNAKLMNETLVAETIRALQHNGLSLPVIVRNIASLLDDNDQILPQHIISLVIRLVRQGDYWQTLRDLLMRIEPTNFVISVIMKECVSARTDRDHVEDVYTNFIKSIPIEEQKNVNIIVRTRFHQLLVSHNIFRTGSAQRSIVSENSNEQLNADDSFADSHVDIECIGSPETGEDNVENSSMSVTEDVNKNVANGTIEPARENRPKVSRNIVTSLANDQFDPRIKIEPLIEPEEFQDGWKLYPIDNISPPKSVWRDRNWKFYLDLRGLQKGLVHKDYQYVVKLLNEYSDAEKSLFTSHCYALLRQQVLAAASHIINIVKLTVQLGINKSGDTLETLLTLGTYIMIDLCNEGAWVLAYYLHKSLRMIAFCKKYDEFAIISAEVCLANRRVSEALDVLKKHDMFKAKGNGGDLSIDSKNELVRIRTIDLLLELSCEEIPERAFNIVEYLRVAQARNYYPIDLTVFLDKILSRCTNEEHDYLLVDLARFVINYNFTLKIHNFQTLIVNTFRIDYELSRHLFRYASHLGVYPVPQLTIPLHVTIRTHWTREETYFVLLEFLESLSKEIGHAVDRIGPNKLMIFIVFEIVPSHREYGANNSNGLDGEEFKNGKAIVKTILGNDFDPPIRTVASEMDRFMKLQSRSVVDYLKSFISTG